MEKHDYEPCDHEGRHGYTLLSDIHEYEMCERCRRGPEAHEDFAGYSAYGKPIFGDVFVTDDGIVPTCDVCGKPQHRVGDDWNGDAGSHYSCQQDTSTAYGSYTAIGG